MNITDKLIEKLQLYNPEISDRELLVNNIMQKAGSSKKTRDYIFAWTEIAWLRRSLAMASIIIIGIFVIQQLFVIKKIEILEKHMISFSTDNILEFQREKVIAYKLLTQSNENAVLTDSIKVSTDDLLELIREYRQLQDQYDRLMGNENQEVENHTHQKL